MVAIVSKDAFKLTLMPNGTGTMESSSRAAELTWWQSGELVRLKSSIKREHGTILLAREGGYDAAENGALLFTLRRWSRSKKPQSASDHQKSWPPSRLSDRCGHKWWRTITRGRSETYLYKGSSFSPPA
jgi:hypothetical protein